MVGFAWMCCSASFLFKGVSVLGDGLHQCFNQGYWKPESQQGLAITMRPRPACGNFKLDWGPLA